MSRTLKRVEPTNDYFYVYAEPNSNSASVGTFMGAWDVYMDEERNSNGFVWLDAQMALRLGPGFVLQNQVKIVEKETPQSNDDVAIELTNYQARIQAAIELLVTLDQELDLLLQNLG